MIPFHHSLSCAAAGKRAAVIVLGVLIPILTASGQNWSDRSEYDIVLAIRAEAVPDKRLELLEQWKQKFPKSDLSNIRAELQLSAYQALGDHAKMLNVAREMVASDPRSFVGLYWLTVLGPGVADPNPELLAQTEHAAHKLIAELPEFFSPDRKPQGSKGTDWENERAKAEVLAHRTLGWVQWQRGTYNAAEAEFRTVLQLDPKQTEISSWLGIVLALQKTSAKQLEAIWHLARAAYIDSGVSLSPAQRSEVRSLLERVYAVYHGGTDGIDQIGTTAITAVMPPADFRVETAQEMAIRKQDEALSRTKPELLAWLRIRRQLEEPNGQNNFEVLTGSVTPRLKGFVVRHSPPKRPTEVVVGLQDPTVEELVLTLDAPLPGPAEPGTPIEFEAMLVSFTTTPFLVYAQGEREKVIGWPTRPR